jgi:hypothetical protein
MPAVQERVIENQLLCWNCEESVHHLAATCPYCHADLSLYPQQEEKIAEPKITQLPRYVAPKPVKQVQSAAVGGTLHTALSLLFLLAGSSLFILAVIIFLFAKDGSFTISWPEHSWTAFFGLGTALMAFGTIFLQRVPEE